MNPLRGPRSGIEQGEPEASFCCVTTPAIESRSIRPELMAEGSRGGRVKGGA
ncbi:MAG: hypothetical protein PVG40_04525 [Desulfobacterales bacterium]